MKFLAVVLLNLTVLTKSIAVIFLLINCKELLHNWLMHSGDHVLTSEFTKFHYSGHYTW